MNEKIKFYYNRLNYEDSVFQNLSKEISELADNDINIHKQKAVEFTAFVVIFLSSALFWFGKGYFTKLGEHAADQTVKAFEKLKERIAERLSQTKDGAFPMVAIGFGINATQVLGYIKTHNKEQFKGSLELVKSLYAEAKDIIDTIKLDIAELVFNLDMTSSKWIPSYLLTADNEVHIFQSEANNS